jgi:type IV secretion system protein VirB8
MINDLKKIKTNELKQYLEESRGLERDYICEILASRNKAWRVALGLGLLALFAFIAVIAAIKREPPTPIVLRVDNATGAVDVLTTIQKSEKSYGEIVDIYWLNNYVLNRESYDYNSVQMLYNTTALLSTPEVQQEYYAIFEGHDARDKILQDHTRIIINILSITPDSSGGKATVRFTKQEKTSNGRETTPKHLIATVAYKYTDAPMSLEDRRVNPLGFQVTSYRVDPESTIFEERQP